MDGECAEGVGAVTGEAKAMMFGIPLGDLLWGIGILIILAAACVGLINFIIFDLWRYL